MNFDYDRIMKKVLGVLLILNALAFVSNIFIHSVVLWFVLDAITIILCLIAGIVLVREKKK
jgi:hypothetical protein